MSRILTISVEQRQAGDVCAVGVQRSYWILIGFGESEAGRKGVKRESNWGQHHCIDAMGGLELRGDLGSGDMFVKREVVPSNICFRQKDVKHLLYLVTLVNALYDELPMVSQAEIALGLGRGRVRIHASYECFFANRRLWSINGHLRGYC